VHRLLKEEWARRQGDALRPTPPPRLGEMAVLSSERERASMEAEREIAAFYAALFMKDKVGERFDGVVSAVVEFGLFVELERWFVDGLVRAEDLGGAFALDPVLHALVEPGSGRAFRVGDKVRVEVVSASPARRRIELALVEHGRVRVAEAAARPPKLKTPSAARGAPPRTGAPPRSRSGPGRATKGGRSGRRRGGRT
jgi:ribonuclease R